MIACRPGRHKPQTAFRPHLAEYLTPVPQPSMVSPSANGGLFASEGRGGYYPRHNTV
jgi:hypothetical protein